VSDPGPGLHPLDKFVERNVARFRPRDLQAMDLDNQNRSRGSVCDVVKAFGIFAATLPAVPMSPHPTPVERSRPPRKTSSCRGGLQFRAQHCSAPRTLDKQTRSTWVELLPSTRNNRRIILPAARPGKGARMHVVNAKFADENVETVSNLLPSRRDESH
jgi:hypothetical protein